MAKAPKKGGTKIIFIKKKGGHAAHHGGAWKVAYADFVTAMMALFMVLWLLSQSDESTRSTLSSYFRTGVFSGSGHVIGDSVPRAPGAEGGGLPVAVPDGSDQAAEQEALEATAAAVERALDAAAGDDAALETLREQIEVQVTDEGLLIQITDGGEDLFFDVSSASLSPTLTGFLQRLGPVLGQMPNELQIHGHTDSRPFPEGSGRTNWDLSFLRADAARALLEHSGLRTRQVVGVLAHGDTAPLLPDDPTAAANRRLSIMAVRRGYERAASRGGAAPTGDAAPAAVPTGDGAVAPGAQPAAAAEPSAVPAAVPAPAPAAVPAPAPAAGVAPPGAH